MLYVEDSDGTYWLKIIELLSEREAYDLVLCLYPDSTAEAFPEPFAASEARQDLERVTTYPDEGTPPCSARLHVTAGLVEALLPHLGDFEDWGDSFVLYPPRERAWVAAFIPHERTALIRDVRLRDFLDAAGIPVSSEEPEGW